jgi:two-component system, OmpR family, response regulator RegX3
LTSDRSRILVVDDEPIVREVLTNYLAREGFDVSAASDGAEALHLIDETAPDVIVLDLMLPRISGLEVLRSINTDGGPRVIILSAKASAEERIAGLDLGADDYVTKPYSPQEVVSRVRAVLRRPVEQLHAPSSLTFGHVEIDRLGHVVLVDGDVVHMTLKEYELLVMLAEQPGRAFTRPELLSLVWGYLWTGATETVTVHMRRLRSKVERDPSRPQHLVTVRGVGYRFEP